MGLLQFDEQTARLLEAAYAGDDITARRRAVLDVLALRRGERVLDVGCGPGFLAFDMAGAVGHGGLVEAIDSSESMMALARARRQPDRGEARVEFKLGDATRLPFADEQFDAAASVQVYEYVPDVRTALRELVRVLRAGGRAVIVDTDWDSIVWHSSDHSRMERVLTAWSEHLADAHLPRALAPHLRQAGLRLERCEPITLLNVRNDAGTISHALIGIIGAFVWERGAVSTSEAEAWARDLRRLGEHDRYFFSLTQYLFLARKPGPAEPAAA